MTEPTQAADSVAPAPTSENPLASALDVISASPAANDFGSDSFLDSLAQRFDAAVNPKPAETAPDAPAAPVEPATPDDGLPPADPNAQPGPDGKDTPQSSWAKLRAKAETAEKKAREYEAKVAEYEAKLKEPVIDPELKRRAERADEYEKRLALVDVEATEPYIQQVKQPAEAIVSKLDIIAQGYRDDLKAENFLAAFNNTDPKARREAINALTEDFDVVDQARVRNLAEEWYAVIEKRDTIKANAHEALQEARKLEAQSKQVMTAREREAYNASVTKTVDKLRAALPQITPGDEDSVQKILDNARNAVTASGFEFDKPDVKAYAATAGAILPDLVAGIRSRDARIKELEDTVSAYTKQAPRGSGGTPASVSPSSPSNDYRPGVPLSEVVGDRYEEFMRNLNR